MSVETRARVRSFGVLLTPLTYIYGPIPELYRLGVVEECAAPGRLMETALGLARNHGQEPGRDQARQAALNQIADMSLRDGYRFEQPATSELSKTEDSKEAMRTFVENREPIFKGR